MPSFIEVRIEVEAHSQSPVGVVKFLVPISLANVRKIQEEMEEFLPENLKVCVVDLSSVEYLPSSGLSLLLQLEKKMRKKGGKVYLLGPSASILETLELTNLHKKFPIIDRLEDALEGVSSE